MQSSARPVEYRTPSPIRALRIREDDPSSGRQAEHASPEPETAGQWANVHAVLVDLGRQRAAHERDVCRWLLAAERLSVHARAGYASLREYAERVLGLKPRQTEERLRVGRALAQLPLLDSALASGELAWTAVREITRVATRHTEEAWLAWARPQRVHQVERAVAARLPGDGPSARPDPSRVKHRLVFEVRAETMALFRDLQSAVRADLGGAADEDALLYEIARRALGGPTDEGRASYQVAVTRCDACGLATIEAAGASHEIGAAVTEMAACDAQLLGDVGSAPSAGPHMGAQRATQTIPPATRRAVMRRDRRRCVIPGCTNHRFLDVHHVYPRAEGGGHDRARLLVLCGSHHRAVHAGTLSVGGDATTGFTCRHADGSAYGVSPSLPAVDVARRVVGMLEHLGFKATRARALVEKALQRVAPDDASILLRAALRAT
jgi:hypothetical protein